MKYLAPILVIFALLTQPNGLSIRVAKSQVVAIFRAVEGECPYRPGGEETRSIISLSNGHRICVAEPPHTAAEEIEKP